MEAKLYGQNKGGMSINGIIKDYYAYAGENISAGDLVEYVNGIAGETTTTLTGTSVDTAIDTNNSTGMGMSTIQLDDSRVLIIYSYNSYLYGAICEINGVEIIVSANTRIGGTYPVGSSIQAKLLPSGNVFIVYKSNGIPYAMIATIDGTTINSASNKQLSTSQVPQWGAISICLLTNSRIFIAYGFGSTDYLYCEVVTIEGTTLVRGSSVMLASANYQGRAISTCLLPNGNVFIAHSYGEDYYLYGMVCTISGTIAKAETDTALSSTQYAGYSLMSTCLLPSGNVFVAHRYGSNDHLYGMVVSINGTTVTKGTDTALVTSEYAGRVLSTCLLPNGSVLVAHGYSSKYYLYGMVCTISGTTITKSNDTAMSTTNNAGYTIMPLLLENGAILIAHSYDSNYHLYAQIWGIDETNNTPTNNISITNTETNYEIQVRKATTGQFDGIAKTSGEGGDDTGHKDVVSIWTLGVTQEFTMADGNTLCDSNGDIFLVREG